MAKKIGTNPTGEFAFFNVVYEKTIPNAPTDGACRAARRQRPRARFILEQDSEYRKSRPPAAGDQEHRTGRCEEEVAPNRASRKSLSYDFVERKVCSNKRTKLLLNDRYLIDHSFAIAQNSCDLFSFPQIDSDNTKLT